MAGQDSVQLLWLTSFVAVVEQGGFTAAATALVRSQPRVSAHVAALEKELGAALLERTHRGVRLTAAGATFLPHARSVLKNLRTGVEAVGMTASALQGRVRVGSYPGAMAVIMAPLVHRFTTAHPGVALELREADPTTLEDAVAAREIDIAVRTADIPQHHHDVPSTPLFSEKIVLVVRRDHPLANAASPDPAALAHETVIGSGDPAIGMDYRDRLDRLGVEPRRLLTVVQPTTVVALVREGHGVGLLGALAARVTVLDSDVTTVALPPPLWMREIREYQIGGTHASDALAAFLDLLRRDGPALTLGAAIWPS